MHVRAWTRLQQLNEHNRRHAWSCRIYVAQNLLTKQYPEQTGSVPLLTQLQRWAEHPKTVLWVHRALSHLSRVSICITMGSIGERT